MRVALQFSHANGFPAPCYRALFAALPKQLALGYVPRYGHDPAFPVTEGWPLLAAQLIAAVEARGEPVLAVGHSLGGYLSLMAAARRPDLFRGVILLDAPIMSRFQGSAVVFAKRVGFIDRVTLAATTRGRRRVWPTAAAAVAHFRSKAPFRRFDPHCLEDYVNFGMTPHPDGIALRFDPEVEYRIYRTIPHDMARIARQSSVPGGLIAGADSALARQIGLGPARRHLRIASVAGSHLFPFEHPAEAAAAIVTMAQDLGVL